ncbi:UNVERIFIED_CONTAM: hypothetical protein O8I53_11380 [Campylobacter lari]
MKRKILLKSLVTISTVPIVLSMFSCTTSQNEKKLSKENERKKAEEERARLEAEENERKKAEEERARLEAEENERKKAEEERARLEAEENERKKAEEERARLEAEENERKKAEEERARLEAEENERKKAEEERSRLEAEENERKRVEEERARLEAEENERKKAEEERARLEDEENERKRVEEERARFEELKNNKIEDLIQKINIIVPKNDLLANEKQALTDKINTDFNNSNTSNLDNIYQNLLSLINNFKIKNENSLSQDELDKINTSINEINSLKFLRKAEKDSYINKIKNAKNMEIVNQTVDEAVNLNELKKQEIEIKKTRDKLVLLKNNEILSSSQKTDINKKIEAAKTIDELKKIKLDLEIFIKAKKDIQILFEQYNQQLTQISNENKLLFDNQRFKQYYDNFLNLTNETLNLETLKSVAINQIIAFEININKDFIYQVINDDKNKNNKEELKSEADRQFNETKKDIERTSYENINDAIDAITETFESLMTEIKN